MKTDQEIRPYETAAIKQQFVIHELARTTTTWVCRHCTKTYNTEHVARMCCANDFACNTDGCEHRLTKNEHYRSRCELCRHNNAEEVWQNRKRKEWDGKAMLYSDTLDRFFADIDEAYCYLEHSDDKLETLRLRICEKAWAPVFDVHDYLSDSLPDDFDGDLPGAREIEEQVLEYIESIASYFGWVPGSYALDTAPYDDELLIDTETSGFEVSGNTIQWDSIKVSGEPISVAFGSKNLAKAAHFGLAYGAPRRLDTGLDAHDAFNLVAQAVNPPISQSEPGIFKAMGTRTGRISCRDPNLTNLPRQKTVDELVVETLEKKMREFPDWNNPCAEIETPKHLCRCDMTLIMRSGCQCGGV